LHLGFASLDGARIVLAWGNDDVEAIFVARYVYVQRDFTDLQLCSFGNHAVCQESAAKLCLPLNCGINGMPRG